MPGTRYSATFDRTYVEEPPPPRNSPVRFSIQSWQGASLQNSPLNGSYQQHARSASTDSLDSSGTGASSSSGSSGTGHSRQVSMEGTGESISTTRSLIKTPSAVSHNPLQFIKVGPVPLYKKATEQIKLVKEVKVDKEQVKGDEEQWQNNLDSWKSRRKKLSERAIQRVEDLKLLEQDHHSNQRKTRTKTFSEIMEDRAQKPRGYNLSIYVENERQELDDLISNNSSEYNKGDSSPASSNHSEDSSEQNNFLQTTILVNNGKNQNQSGQEHISNIAVNYECPMYSSNSKNNQLEDRNSKEGSVDCVEEDCNGVYTIDSGLESFSSSQRVGDIQDTSSELSIDSSGGYDRAGIEDETDIGHSAENLLAGIEELHELQTELHAWPENLEQKEGHVQLSLHLWLRPELKTKDFGFSICEAKGLCVEAVKNGGVAWQTGLRPHDTILAINGENISSRSRNSVLFIIKQSIYNGHLDLIISRIESEDTKASDELHTEDAYQAEQSNVNVSTSSNAVSAIKKKLQNGRSFDDCWKNDNSQNNAFRSRSKSESSRTWEETPNSISKKLPPPIPAKPKVKQTVSDEVTAHAPIVRTISNEMRLERMCTGESVTYLPSNGVIDISQEMQDAEDELEREMVVYSDSQIETDSEDLVFCVDQDLVLSTPVLAEEAEKKVPVSSAVEEEIVRTEVEPVETYFLAHESFEEENKLADIKPSECEYLVLTQEAAPTFHQVKEDNGLNIVFESHPNMTIPPKQEIPLQEQLSNATDSFFELDSVGHSETHLNLYQAHQRDSEDGLPPSLVSGEPQQVSQDEAPLDCDIGSHSELQDDSQESEWVREELSALCGKRELSSLDSSFSQLGSCSSILHPDDQLLVDLDSQENLHLEPPKEKPPPPPPSDSPEQIPKMNTFKRVKKEIYRRRSDFLGIDPTEDEIDIDVPPPPDLSEILKSERDLERQNRLWLEKERFLSGSSSHEPDSQDDEEIARQEKEIIKNLEKEEKARLALNDADKEEYELIAAVDQQELCSEEDARILRLQEERRHMEEERFQREEVRIKLEEDRLFKEREIALKKQEEAVVELDCVGSLQLNNSLSPQDSKPRILPKPNRLSRNLEKARSEPIGEESSMEKEALLLERERLHLEQERLQREKEDYRRQAELKQRKAFNLDACENMARLSNEVTKAGSMLSSRDAVIFASKKPQGLSDSFSEGSVSEVNGIINGVGLDSMIESSQFPQHASRTAGQSLGAAPKARIIQNEQWINQPEHAANKRHSDPPGSRGYNQNHWLVQEAEMRRITEQNERHQRQQQQQGAPELRRHSAATVALRTGPQVQLPRHISSTTPRPYQRPAPPPPPKPPHGNPVQTEQPWNYHPVSSVSMVTRGNSKEKILLRDMRNFRSESVLGVPAPWVGPTDVQPEHLLSVSGKERCSHCAEPLGRGGAMIIESLQLYYHMQCFSCCVCQAQLGNGTCGTDVRVRNHKLHCQNCYSNDEAGLKFSQV